MYYFSWCQGPDLVVRVELEEIPNENQDVVRFPAERLHPSARDTIPSLFPPPNHFRKPSISEILFFCSCGGAEIFLQGHGGAVSGWII